MDDGETVVVSGVGDALLRMALEAFFTTLSFKREGSDGGFRAGHALRSGGVYRHYRDLLKAREAVRALSEARAGGSSACPPLDRTHETRVRAGGAREAADRAEPPSAAATEEPRSRWVDASAAVPAGSHRPVLDASTEAADASRRVLGPARPPPAGSSAAEAAGSSSSSSGRGFSGGDAEAEGEDEDDEVGPLLPGAPQEEVRRRLARAAAAERDAEAAEAAALAEAREGERSGGGPRDGRPEWMAGIAGMAGLSNKDRGEGVSKGTGRACLGWNRTATSLDRSKLSQAEVAAAAATGNRKLAALASGKLGGGGQALSDPSRPLSLMELHQQRVTSGPAAGAAAAAAPRGVPAPGSAAWRPFDREKDLAIPKMGAMDASRLFEAAGGLYSRFG